MNIKQYAINSKLKRDSKLLDYILKNEPVPIDVLNDEFSDILIEDAISDLELLETDYKSYLQKTIKVGIVPLKNDQLEVTGEIPDTLINTIIQLNNVTREEIIDSLIKDVISSINESKKAIVKKVEYNHSEPIELPTKQIEVIEKQPESTNEEIELMDKINELDDILFIDNNTSKIYHVEDDKLVEYDNAYKQEIDEQLDLLSDVNTIDELDIDLENIDELPHYIDEVEHVTDEVEHVAPDKKTHEDAYQILVDIIDKYNLQNELSLDIKELNTKGEPLTIG